MKEEGIERTALLAHIPKFIEMMSSMDQLMVMAEAGAASLLELGLSEAINSDCKKIATSIGDIFEASKRIRAELEGIGRVD